MWSYPEKLDLKMRTSCCICISPMFVKYGFVVERTFFVSDVPKCLLESHKGGCLPFPWLVVLTILSNYKKKKKPFVFLSHTSWHSLETIHNFCPNMFRKYELLQLVTPLDNHKLNHGIQFSWVIKYNRIGRWRQTQPGPYRSSFNPV